MTSELRPASEIWSMACGAYEDATAEVNDLPMRDMVIEGDKAAAAVIEAYAAEREAKWKALAETLAGALEAHIEYCDICYGWGSIIEEDSATGADLWRDCPGCGPATDALTRYKEQRDAS